MRSLVTWGVSSAVSLLCLLLISHPAWAQIQFDDKVIAADGAANEQFGYSVSVSGNVAFVGVPFDDDRGTDTGSVYIYEQADGNWSQVGKLSAADGAASDYFGWSVAVDGDFAFVGSRLDDDRGSNSGSAYVFERIDGIWRQVAKLTPTDGGNNDQFGYSVSVSGITAVVGAYQDSNGNVSNSGSAYVFERANGTWTQQAKLLASDAQASDGFGISVSISDDVIIAGASSDDDKGSSSGSAYVFEFDGNGWQEVNKLVAPYGFTSDQFGISVSVDGNIAVVGSHTDDSVVPGDNNVLSNAGSAYVFERINNDWKQVARLTAEDDALSSALFGFDVDVSGNVLVVGAYNDVEGNIRGGSAYFFERFNQGWRRTSKVIANDRAASDQFGFSVALDGRDGIIGAPADDTPRGSNAGSVYFFDVENRSGLFANPLAVTTPEETPVGIALTGQGAQNLTFELLSQPSNGVLSGFNAQTGAVTYTPAAGFDGADAFSFRVVANGEQSAPATVSITVTPVNDAPTANAQAVSTNEEVAVNITLTGNDPDGDNITFALVDQPDNGTLSNFNAQTGAVTYTPADGFSGLDSFTFRVSDGQLNSTTASVTITVNDVNDAPVANDQSVTTEEDTAITITLTGNDPDGDDLVFAVLQQPANGTLSNFDAVTGTVVYTPAENFSGQDSFTFRVSDGQASSGPATVTINVEEGNDPPTVEFDIDGEDVEVNEGESVTLEVTVTDDENAQVSIDWDLDGDGQFDDAQGPSAIFRGNDGPQTVRVSVRASDGEQTTVASLTVRVLNVAPEVTIEGPTEGEIGQELNFVAVAVDPAGDGDLLAYSWSFGDNGPNAFGPNSRRTFTEAGTYTVSVVVDDGEGGRTTESIEVEITAPLPEVFDTTIPLEGDEGEDLAFSAAATGVEPLTYRWDFGDGTEEAEGQAVTHAFGDNGTYIVTLTITDALDRSVTFDESVTILNVAPSVTLLESILPPQEGEAFGFNATAIDPAGDNDTLTYRWDFGDGSEDQEGVDLTNVEHTYADSGVFELMLIVSDEDGGTTIVTRTINVGVQAPNITSLGGDATGVEASPVSFEAEAADPGNDALTYRWDFGDGSPVHEGVDLTEVEHAYGDNGSYTVTLTVSDEDGSAAATRDVLIVNAPPTVEIEGPTEGNEGQELLWVALGEDPAGENDPLSYRWNFSDGATAEGRTARHTFANDGTYTVTVTALDDDGGAAAAVITVVIGNGAPVIGRVSAPSVGFEGQRLGLSAEVDDAVADLLTWTWDFGDGTILEGADLGEVEHVWANNGDFTVTLTVTDDGDLEDSITFDVTILNLPPRIVSQPSRLLPDDLAYRYTIDVEEPGDDELFFELQQNPEGMTVTDEGEIVWDVALSQLDEGPFEVLVEVCDEDGACDSQRWRIDNNFLDEDGDDVPDLCEEEFGFEDGDLDNDQDGISNRDECLDGTDPNVSNGPNAPTRNLPEDDSRVEDRTPELSAFGCVDPDGDNVSYTFEAYADAALDQLLVRSPLVPEADNVTVWEVPFSLPEDATIFWRVRCSDRTANSPWSDTGSFVIDSFNAAPPTPELVSPMGSVDTLTPELVVDPVEDPDGDAVVYLFEVYADAELTDLVTGGESETTAFVVDVELSEDTPYWWTAAARDARGEQSAYADAWRFEVNTENGLPTAPVIVAPEEGQIFIDRTSVVLRWLQAEDPEGDALTYDMQLATDADFNEVIDDRAGMPAGEQQAMDVDLEELALGQTYHARVRANDPFGAGPFATVSFELRSSNRAPEAPVLISPIDDERVQVGDVDFVFEAAVDPDEDVLSYVLRVFPDATVGEDPVVVTEPVELGQGEQTITVSLDIDPGNYTWDLTATDPEGEEVTAGPASFVLVKTTNEPPTAPVAIAPIEGVVLTEAGFDLEVENATDPEGQALRYTFEIYSDQMLTDRVAIFEDVAEGDSGQTTAAVDALEDGTWFWVAFATDVEGAVGPSSAVAEFVLDTDGIDDDMDPNDNVDPDVNGNVSGGGCDCAVPGQSGPRAPTWPLIALALAALVIVRRKR